MSTTQEVLQKCLKDLKSLNIYNTPYLTVHTSMKSINEKKLTPQMLLECLRQSISPSSHLIVPTLSYLSTENAGDVFNVRTTPSDVGLFTETVRKLFPQNRSLHPTHSVCVFGNNSEKMCLDHLNDSTPVGRYSPLSINLHNDGLIMMIGCGPAPNTTMHAVEELVNPEYLFLSEKRYSVIDINQKQTVKEYRPHGFKTVIQRYDRLIKLLSTNDYLQGELFSARVLIIKCSAILKKAVPALEQNSYFFVDKHR
ncbi:MAG TPA: AAC(3) family N-acetyltransferase [Petrotogaceae bacterium]|nr:AAC(3) family N-acetyltransferase [Petrotogaceae bacterium]HQC41666.1 AAC(3) family N-acetyltransferase [Petrotogaceae bacterium]